MAGTVPNASAAGRGRQAGGAAQDDRVPRDRQLPHRPRRQADHALAHR